MGIDLVFLVMMLSHVLGDFYFQSDKLAKKRQEKYLAVVRHGVLYALAVAGTVLLCLEHGMPQLYLALSVSLAHFLVDSVKFILQKRSKGSPAWIKNNLFLLDQAVHFFTLALIWFAWGRGAQVRWFVAQEMVHLPDLPITILLAALLVVRPVGIWIANSNLRSYWPQEGENDLKYGSSKNGGKTIGYLERIIVLVFLMYQQFGAIAFVLTAKSVARFKEIEKNQNLAEYYLIGTLMSVGSAMLITMLLGLAQS